MTQQNDAFVRFSNVQKTYDGETLVIKDLNLDIARGEFVTLLGPSGSGKSTSLMLLAGFEQPTAGEVYLDGRLLNDVAPYQRNIGMVFQNYALFPHMTVLDNVAYPLRVRKMNRVDARKRAQKALEMVRLGDFGARYPKQLSGGQQQRVAVARSLVFDPALVLMDEPLGALDKKLREEMQIEIKHIHEELGVTIVFVTHDQDEALTMSDRAAVFNDGRIQQIAPPHILYEEPVNRFVSTFVGETNLLPGKVESRDGKVAEIRLGNGDQIVATAVDDIHVGDKVEVTIRPERVHLGSDSADHSHDLHAKVVETIYHGAIVHVVFKLSDGSEVKSQVNASKLPSDVRVGQDYTLSFDPSVARVFKAGS